MTPGAAQRKQPGGPELPARLLSRAAGDGRDIFTVHVPPVTLSLPMPPSANDLFKNRPGKGRVKTRVYDDWLGHAGWVLKAQRPHKISGPFLTVHSFERTSAQADVDNRIKAVHDLLVKHAVTDDDRFLVGSLLAWAPAASKMMRVMILPAADYSFQFRLAQDGSTGGFFLTEPPQESA